MTSDGPYRQIAKEIIGSIRHLDMAAERAQQNLSVSERAMVVKPIADTIYVLQNDLLPLLVKRDPTLTNWIHPSIPLGGRTETG